MRILKSLSTDAAEGSAIVFHQHLYCQMSPIHILEKSVFGLDVDGRRYPHELCNLFDSVQTFENMSNLQPGDSKTKLAVADSASPDIHIFDIRGEGNKALETFRVGHAAAVTDMQYNAAFDCGISTDSKGEHHICCARIPGHKDQVYYSLSQ